MTKKITRKQVLAIFAVLLLSSIVVTAIRMNSNSVKPEKKVKAEQSIVDKQENKKDESSTHKNETNSIYVLNKMGGKEGICYVVDMTSGERSLLEKLVFAEAGTTGSLEEKVSIAAEVLNRVRDKSGLFPDNVGDVIYQEGQYYDGQPYWVDTNGNYREVTDSDVTKEVKLAVEYALQDADPVKVKLGTPVLFHYSPQYNADSGKELINNQVIIGETSFYSSWDGYPED